MIVQYSKAHAAYQYTFDICERNILRKQLKRELGMTTRQLHRYSLKGKPVEELNLRIANLKEMIAGLAMEYKK